MSFSVWAEKEQSNEAFKDSNMKNLVIGQVAHRFSLFFFFIREPYFISSIQHIEDILITGWSANSKIKCTANKKLAVVTKYSFSLISSVVRVKMGQGGRQGEFLDRIPNGLNKSELKLQQKWKHEKDKVVRDEAARSNFENNLQACIWILFNLAITCLIQSVISATL